MLAVVCHDAGGAEVVSSWLSQFSGPYFLVLDGPAKDIFERKLGSREITSLDKAIKDSDWVLCGTSWTSNLERIAIRKAKSLNKKVVSYLDHWINYRERFQDNSQSILPDEIWVGDVYALRIAKNVLPEVKIIYMPNMYFKELENAFDFSQKNKNEKRTDCSALFVCEPIAEIAKQEFGNELHYGYTQIDAINYFLKNIDKLSQSIKSIKFRPHPSEPLDKYNWVKSCCPIHVLIGGRQSLIEEIVDADIIVGCQSMAMVVGLIGGKEVVSSIPPNGQKCALPHKEILHLQNIIGGHND